MEFDREYRLWMESFDTVSDFMINPEHSNKTYEQIFKEFKKSGGKNIGYGAFGMVYSHPKWPYVLKTFKSDDSYLKFVRYAYDNPHPSFPKFYGKPQRVSPKIQTINDKRYLVRIEKLKPISKKVFGKINFRLADFFKLIHNPDDVSGEERYKLLNMKSDLYKVSKSVYKLLEGLYLIRSNLMLPEDLHDGNVMVRNDGQFVWVDPVKEEGEISGGENSLMTPETFHILYQIINKINKKFKNAEVELERYDDNFFDIHLSMTLDISKCGIKNINILLDNEEEIREFFKDGGVLYFDVDDIQFTPNNIKVDLTIKNMGTMSNVRDGVGYLEDIPHYLNWMNGKFQSELCDFLAETTENIQESFQFDREYRKLIKEYTSEEGEDIVDLLKSKYKNRRIILTDGEFKPVDKSAESQGTRWKPSGSWYSLGEYWARWMRSEMPDWFMRYNKIYMLDLDYSKILRINNSKKMAYFQNKYGIQPYRQHNDFTLMIDWKRVAEDYTGIEIIPMIWENSRDWYRMWDIPSGCIWDSSAIKGWKEIEFGNKPIEMKDETSEYDMTLKDQDKFEKPKIPTFANKAVEAMEIVHSKYKNDLGKVPVEIIDRIATSPSQSVIFSKMLINTGISKIPQTILDSIKSDEKYLKFFLKRFGDSIKPAYVHFLTNESFQFDEEYRRLLKGLTLPKDVLR